MNVFTPLHVPYLFSIYHEYTTFSQCKLKVSSVLDIVLKPCLARFLLLSSLSFIIVPHKLGLAIL